MYSLEIFSVHVRRPRTTKFHPTRINPAELSRQIDFQDSGRDVTILLSILFW